MIKAFYICDTLRKTRLAKWHRTLRAAEIECKRLNAENDRKAGRALARYFCGDWDEVDATMNLIDSVSQWPVEYSQ